VDSFSQWSTVALVDSWWLG